MTDPLQDFIAQIATNHRAPVGVAVAAVGAALGLALVERALAYPAPDADQSVVTQSRELVGSLRSRIMEVVQADLAAAPGLEAAFADTTPDADGRQAGARVPAYRAARRLVDYVIQALTLLDPVQDTGNRYLLADLETAWRLLATALEAAIVACEQHLFAMSSFFWEAEHPALEAASLQGREWVARAEGKLSWRLGHTDAHR